MVAQQYGHLLHCGLPFPPSFVAALAQAVAAFVESVLRYGIPPDFVCALIRVRSGCDHAVPPRTVIGFASVFVCSQRKATKRKFISSCG